MLGFSALGELATGQPPPNPIPTPPGAGKRRDFPSYIPQPPYDVTPAAKFKRVKPIWDRRQEIVEPPAVALPPEPAQPLPPPPVDLFAPPRIIRPGDLPRFGHQTPDASADLANRMAATQDRSDSDGLRKRADAQDVADINELLQLLTRKVDAS